MNEIDEETFFEKWKDACEGKKEKDLVTNWKDTNMYSYLILGEKGLKKKNFKNIERKINDLSDKKSVVELLLKSMKKNIDKNLDLHQEYYSADVVYYSKIDNISKKSVLLNHIVIHLEHENIIDKSLEEIAQLQIIPGDLDVLVTYPNYSFIEDGKIKEQLNKYKESMNEKFDKKLLIIFGFLDDTNSSKKTVTWKGYKFNTDNKTSQKEFVPLSLENIF